MPFARSLVIQGVGLLGFASFVEGVREVYAPAALVVGGALAVVWAALQVRRAA